MGHRYSPAQGGSTIVKMAPVVAQEYSQGMLVEGMLWLGMLTQAWEKFEGMMTTKIEESDC